MLIKGKKTTKNKTVKEYTVSKEELNGSQDEIWLVGLRQSSCTVGPKAPLMGN